MYQLFRSLAYIHSLGICHRDIKPQNLLLDPESGVLKLCDFGSAKILVAGEANVSYICSRYYRAPELIFGATNYTTNIGETGGTRRPARGRGCRAGYGLGRRAVVATLLGSGRSRVFSGGFVSSRWIRVVFYRRCGRWILLTHAAPAVSVVGRP